MSLTPGRIWRGAPSVGDDTTDILSRMLNFSKTAIEKLHHEKVSQPPTVGQIKPATGAPQWPAASAGGRGFGDGPCAASRVLLSISAPNVSCCRPALESLWAPVNYLGHFDLRRISGVRFDARSGEPCGSGATVEGALRRATSGGRGIWRSSEVEGASETAG
jgi:hypothetical protein